MTLDIKKSVDIIEIMEKNIFELMQSTYENPKESYLKLLAKRLGFYSLN
jgi:hypothetical protein